MGPKLDTGQKHSVGVLESTLHRLSCTVCEKSSCRRAGTVKSHLCLSGIQTCLHIFIEFSQKKKKDLYKEVRMSPFVPTGLCVFELQSTAHHKNRN
jgi:hypothetical protein